MTALTAAAALGALILTAGADAGGPKVQSVTGFSVAHGTVRAGIDAGDHRFTDVLSGVTVPKTERSGPRCERVATTKILQEFAYSLSLDVSVVIATDTSVSRGKAQSVFLYQPETEGPWSKGAQSFNLLLVKGGIAKATRRGRYRVAMSSAEREARRAKRGLWRKCPA